VVRLVLQHGPAAERQIGPGLIATTPTGISSWALHCQRYRKASPPPATGEDD
jgi:hypothetical protein